MSNWYVQQDLRGVFLSWKVGVFKLMFYIDVNGGCLDFLDLYQLKQFLNTSKSVRRKL